jgi:hypothetical protein
MPPITDAQLTQLQTLVSDLVADKTTADEATAASNEAQAALTAAQNEAQAANVNEATADGILAADVQTLDAFVQSLAGDPTTPPATLPTTS